MNVSDGRPNAPERKKRKSSAVTSGRKLFVDGDPNSAWSRRFRDLMAGHVADMGGAGTLSHAQQSLVRRASTIECELELMEGQLSMGMPVDLDIFTRSSSHLRRILETLGVERKPRDVTPTLEEYLKKYDSEPAEQST